MRLPTFSQLSRAFRCRLSNVLEQVGTSNEDARAGKTRHHFFQRVTEHLRTSLKDSSVEPTPVSLAEARDLALGEVEDAADYELLSLIPLDSLRLENVAAEVAVAFDVNTGNARELGRGIERKYEGIKETEIAGTIDRLALIGDDGTSDGGVYIGDYKGIGYKRKADEDEQLLAGALAASRLFDRSWALLEIIRIVDAEPVHSKATVTSITLAAFELQLANLVDQITSDDAAYRRDGVLPPAETGEHCRYCPSFAYCPAKMALARAAIGGDSEEIQKLVRGGAALLTTENAPRLYQLVHDAERVLDIIRDSLRDFARVTPIPLPDGRVYGANPGSEEREVIDGEKALAALRELYGDSVDAAATVKVTLSGIDRATRKMKGASLKKGDLKEWAEKAELLLKQRGLLRVIKGGTVKAYRPKD